MNPLVSVIIANRNGERYLAQAISSILTQTFSDFELIIVESSTTDKSLKIERRFNDPRIRIILYDKRGLASALNKGIEEAKGKYIAKMDADDISQPTRLEKQVKLLESNPDISLVHTSGYFINNNGNMITTIENPFTSRLWPIKDNPLWPLLRWDYIISGSAMIRSNILKVNRFDETTDNKSRAEDWDLFVRLATKYKFAKINEPLYNYRLHSESSTSFTHTIPLLIGLCYTMTRWMKIPSFTSKERLRLFTTILMYWISTPFRLIRILSGKLR